MTPKKPTPPVAMAGLTGIPDPKRDAPGNTPNQPLTQSNPAARAAALGPRRWLEKRRTRDFKAPLSDDDREMEHSWACVPVRPTADPAWFVVDSSHDRRTTWARWRKGGAS
jgi:hypothetical protein